MRWVYTCRYMPKKDVIYFGGQNLMAWYDEAIFYHIYPLGMTGAPEINDYSEPVNRLDLLFPWIEHIKNIGCNALYIGPLFQSVGHGYETTDYKLVDNRLGTNDTFKRFVYECHKNGIKVIVDGVFNHTGRDFFAFKDIKENRENSRYKDWYTVNFWGNNEYNDGFAYENWGGYNLMAKFNQKNPEVKNYICDVIRFWVSEFDIDGIRLDAADVLDFDFMKDLRRTADEVKSDFWLMGEVIHGDYNRWANESTLHSVTNYHLHKALYSGHNDQNYFEIAHTVKRLCDMGNLKLYNFVDNHDVERITTKLTNKANFVPVHILLYTLPGIPSLYYGSEFAIEGKKTYGTDAPLRPMLDFKEYSEKAVSSSSVKLISALGKIKQGSKELSYGDYKELLLTNKQYAFARNYNGSSVIVTVNNDNMPCNITVSSCGHNGFIGALSGKKISAQNGNINISLEANSGDIWLIDSSEYSIEPIEIKAEIITETVAQTPIVEEKVEEVKTEPKIETVEVEKSIKIPPVVPNKPLEEMDVPELQRVILDKLSKNGPLTDRMIKDVEENVYKNSLINWAKSFNN